MDKKNINFDDNEIANYKFHQHNSLISINNIDINKIVVSNEEIEYYSYYSYNEDSNEENSDNFDGSHEERFDEKINIHKSKCIKLFLEEIIF